MKLMTLFLKNHQLKISSEFTHFVCVSIMYTLKRFLVN